MAVCGFGQMATAFTPLTRLCKSLAMTMWVLLAVLNRKWASEWVSSWRSFTPGFVGWQNCGHLPGYAKNLVRLLRKASADAVPDLGRWPRQMAFAQRLCICLAMTKRFIWLASIWCFFAACGFGQMAMTMRLLVLANISILANAVTKVLLLPTYPSSRD